jgi:organic radical activating enzyme
VTGQPTPRRHRPATARGAVSVVGDGGRVLANADVLVVSELFGPTFQGEGASCGQRAMFLRLGRCNLDCTWCDTPYTWDWTRFDPDTELRRVSVHDVITQLADIDAPLLVITGGEPMLQQRQLIPVLEAARTHGWRVEVETNGTIAPIDAVAALVDRWNVSPKLAGSGVDQARRWQPDALRALAATGRAIGKFVVGSTSELDEVAAIAEATHLTDVWIMAEGTDSETLQDRMAMLAPHVLARGWNLSNRLQVMLWGNVRGR